MNKKQNLNSANFSHLSSGVLVLENKTIFKGIGIGYQGTATGEVCFNTSLTGYQEIISDPSYADKLSILHFHILEMLALIKKIMSLTRFGLKELFLILK